MREIKYFKDGEKKENLRFSFFFFCRTVIGLLLIYVRNLILMRQCLRGLKYYQRPYVIILFFSGWSHREQVVWLVVVCKGCSKHFISERRDYVLLEITGGGGGFGVEISCLRTSPIRKNNYTANEHS